MKKVYKVLLAEDDDSSAKLLIHTLERYNFQVVHVADGMAGLTKIRNQTFDLVISDIMMPYLDGLSFVEKGKDFLKNTPVIMLTSVGDKDQIVRAAQSRVSAYLLKPITTASLMEKIQAVLMLGPDMIVDKKTLPYVIKVVELSISEILIELTGVPSKKGAEEIYEKFHHYLAGRSSFTNLRININTEFFYENSSLQALDDLIGKIVKSTNIRANFVFINSDYFAETVIDLAKYSNLTAINIISK
ncbi:response regulator transcription factor [Leptospira ilyithenensis]|uniref:Response regulator n=1 Tax=Leptospira ilyithenensis TaxID=2484901 RepID=A0A4R9LRB0_9LEPT|nr:response regulator [Leptospira ilyithenensis]TGN10912.1 response regulator [Leptospira ilyithenensis]